MPDVGRAPPRARRESSGSPAANARHRPGPHDLAPPHGYRRAIARACAQDHRSSVRNPHAAASAAKAAPVDRRAKYAARHDDRRADDSHAWRTNRAGGRGGRHGQGRAPEAGVFRLRRPLKMTELLQIVFDALSLGSLYALGALGIALIFGVMRLVNFAHGDFIAFWVFAMLWPSINAAAIVFAGNLPFYLLVPLLLLVGAALSMLSEVIVFRRFRNTNPATMMIASFALGFAIRNLLLMLYSSRPKSITLWPSLSLPVELLGARIPMLQVVTIAITLAVLIALTLFLKRTRYGLEMRAAAENFTMARMLGVRANGVILLAFCISWILEAAVRLILATNSGTADIGMGANVMLIAFIATVIGGLGSVPGAVAAGFLIGGASVVFQATLPHDARVFRDAFVYGAVIVVLLVRPQGLFAPKSAKQRV